MSDSPYVQFYTSDFLAGTGGMTASTKGVYITLLCLMYEAEAPLHQSWSLLARRCGCTLSAFKKAIAELEDDGKVTCSDEGLWSPKCEKHIKFRRDRRDSAKAAAEKRWEKSQQKQQKSDATASLAHCQPEPEPEPVKRDTNVSPKKRGSRLPADWVLPMAYGEWARGEGWSDQAIRLEAEKFRDFWVSKAGRDAAKLDWLATWRNWMRNSKTPKIQPIDGGHNGARDRSSRPSQARPNRADPALEQIARLAGLGTASGDGGR